MQQAVVKEAYDILVIVGKCVGESERERRSESKSQRGEVVNACESKSDEAERQARASRLMIGMKKRHTARCWDMLVGSVVVVVVVLVVDDVAVGFHVEFVAVACIVVALACSVEIYGSDVVWK